MHNVRKFDSTIKRNSPMEALALDLTKWNGTIYGKDGGERSIYLKGEKIILTPGQLQALRERNALKNYSTEYVRPDLFAMGIKDFGKNPFYLGERANKKGYSIVRDEIAWYSAQAEMLQAEIVKEGTIQGQPAKVIRQYVDGSTYANDSQHILFLSGQSHVIPEGKLDHILTPIA